MKLSDVVRSLRGKDSVRKFSEALSVSHTSVVEWEHGANVGPWNRIKLLTLAKQVGAAPKLIKALESSLRNELGAAELPRLS